MDPDRENDFWREGGSRYLRNHDYPNINKRSSKTKNRLENRDANSQSRSHRNAAPIYPVSYKNNQWPRRRSIRRIANFTTTETTDEEYFALYKKSSHNKKAYKANEKIFSNSSGDCVVEPIDTILSRYQRKSSKSAIELTSESSMEALKINDERKSKRKLNKSLRAKKPESISLESAEDGKWSETNCFGSVWYSKSELNVTPERTSVTRTRNQVSRIPRLRHLPDKRSARAYRTKNDARPNSLCK